VLLVIVAAASRGDGVTPAKGGGASETVRDYFLSAYMVFGVAFLVAIVYLVAKERESLPTKRSPHRDLRQLAQLALLVAALFIVGPHLFRAFGGNREREKPDAAPNAAETRRERDRPADDSRAQFRWAPLVALGALGVVSLGVLAARRSRRRDLSTEQDFADALAAVLDDALADLRADRDLRRATIAAYARMEGLLAAHHVPRDPSEAPFEYLGRVLLELDTSAGAVFELTALFERAKFSRHAIDEDMRDEAIAALVAVRDELRSGP
jgi:hypothetical protein